MVQLILLFDFIIDSLLELVNADAVNPVQCGAVSFKSLNYLLCRNQAVEHIEFYLGDQKQAFEGVICLLFIGLLQDLLHPECDEFVFLADIQDLGDETVLPQFLVFDVLELGVDDLVGRKILVP